LAVNKNFINLLLYRAYSYIAALFYEKLFFRMFAVGEINFSGHAEGTNGLSLPVCCL